jgi:hypothetical protein
MVPQLLNMIDLWGCAQKGLKEGHGFPRIILYKKNHPLRVGQSNIPEMTKKEVIHKKRG